MSKKPVLLLDCYIDEQGAAGFFLPWLGRAEVIAVHVTGQPLPTATADFAAVVITGSEASVWEHRPWSLATTELIRRFVHDEVPLLGICYGHQLLGEAMGGQGTVRAAATPEVGYHEVELDRGDPLLDALPGRLRTFLTHGDEVQAKPGLEVVGRSAGCPVQAIRVPGAPAWGVQFHTEYPLDEQRRLLQMRQDKHPEQSYDAQALYAQRVDTASQAEALFGRFLEIAGW